MYRFGFHIDIAAIELKTFVILQPVEGGISFSISSGARKTVSYGIFASCISAVSLPFSTLPSSLPLKCSAPGSSFHCFHARFFHAA